MIKVETHVLENNAELLNRTGSLLLRLSTRCGNTAHEMGCPDSEQLKEAQELLYEMEKTLEFVYESLEGRSDFVREIVSKAQAAAV